MTKWTYSAQKGTPGHGFGAQVWDEKGQSIARINATNDPKDATAIAKNMSKVPEMREALENIIKETSAIELNTLIPFCRDNPKFEWAITLAKSLLKEMK